VFDARFFLVAGKSAPAQILADTFRLKKKGTLAVSRDDSTKMDVHMSLAGIYIENNNDSSLFHAQQVYLPALKLQSQ
jgi:hypothetical protein